MSYNLRPCPDLANLERMESMQKNYFKLSLDMHILSEKAKASHTTPSPTAYFSSLFSPSPHFFPLRKNKFLANTLFLQNQGRKKRI